MRKTFVISLGGSLIFPEEIDAVYLRKFKNIVVQQIKKGNKFILITGGGKICRKYQAALKYLTKPTNTELDWMGIYTTHTNAELVRLMFGSLAHPEIIKNGNRRIKFNRPLLIAAGWLPGWSTDYDAVLMAKIYKAKTVINLSNVDFIYDKDPNKYSNAKKISGISWQELFKIIGNKWIPGANLPFDPIAGKLAQKHKIKVVVAAGKNLKNLENILNQKPFTGTVIK